MSSAPIPDTAPPSTTPFRFKRKRKSSTTSPTSQSPPPKPTHHHHHRHRRRHHHRHHHHHSPSDPPPDPFIPDPETAFRESLFDAMADDEGALYWEGVYGQPLHTYSQYYDGGSETPHTDASGNAEEGKAPNVQKMTEDEYVDYVRRKMWEKSHGYVLEERARREEEMRRRRRKKSEMGREKEGETGRADDRAGWARGVEEALRRGEERRKKKARWKGVWEGYVRGWEGMRWCADDDDDYDNDVVDEATRPDKNTNKKNQGGSSGDSNGGLRARIPWPVESGKWSDVARDTVETFFAQAPSAAAAASTAAASTAEAKKTLDLEQVLKRERIRWHPDKMQQRARAGGAGGSGVGGAGEGEEGKGIDAETLQTVTAIFQIVDRLWGEMKGNHEMR